MKKTSRKFSYQPRPAETYQKHAKGGNDFDSFLKSDIPLFAPKTGKHRVRILPPTWDNPDHYGYQVWINWGIGPDKGSYLSLSKMKHQPDPILEEKQRAVNDGREEDAKNLTAKSSTLVFVIDRKNEDAGPQIWRMPYSVDKEICVRAVDEQTGEVLNVDDPEEGHDITFNKDGEGLLTKYVGVNISPRPTPLSDDADTLQQWMDFVVDNPIPTCLQFHDYDYIKSVLNGGVAEPAKKAKAEEPDDYDDNNLQGSEKVRAARKPVKQEDIESDFGDDGGLDDDPPFDVDEDPVETKPSAQAVGDKLRRRVRR